ncbi:MAG: DUF2726 domain-containing protein [Verrucomicrobiia bacterium]
MELDDTSHRRADRSGRDKFVNQLFKCCSVPLLRIQIANHYNFDEIKKEITRSTEALQRLASR